MSSVQSPMAYRKMLTRSFSDLCASHEAIWYLSNLWHHFFPVGSLAVKGLQAEEDCRPGGEQCFRQRAAGHRFLASSWIC